MRISTGKALADVWKAAPNQIFDANRAQPVCRATGAKLLTPAYTESAAAGASPFALAYDAQTATGVRGEIGTWTDAAFTGAGGTEFRLIGRIGWAPIGRPIPSSVRRSSASRTRTSSLMGLHRPPISYCSALARAGGGLAVGRFWPSSTANFLAVHKVMRNRAIALTRYSRLRVAGRGRRHLVKHQPSSLAATSISLYPPSFPMIVLRKN